MEAETRTGPQSDGRRDCVMLAAAHRICALNGFHEAIDGHMSLRSGPAREEMLLSPFPLHWAEVTASSLPRVRLADGTVLEGDYQLDRPSWCVHSALQRQHPIHRCFIHCHTPYATALACRE